jgi:3',5'-nucleoside bisphosphate phosphatase
MHADLHLHTCFSDGTYTPEELAGHGKRCDLAALSVVDHDSLEACPRMEAACRQHGIEFIPGSELTAEVEGRELHLLAYGIDIDHPQMLQAMGHCQEVRQNRIREIVGCLNRLGVPMVAEVVFHLANCRSPGRPHVARALVQGGYCHDLDQAFERFLKRGRPAWVPKYKMSASEAIHLIHEAGGVAVLAHPGIGRTDGLLPQLVAEGLDGIECFHTKHSTPITEHYMMLADRHKLIVTGGSDCHGMNKGQPLIGTVRLPYEHVEQLKRRIQERRSKASADRPPLQS